MALEKGDVVKLKSGGPHMTVEAVGDYSGFAVGPKNGAKCVWFDASKTVSKVFDVAVLEKVDTSQSLIS